MWIRRAERARDAGREATGIAYAAQTTPEETRRDGAGEAGEDAREGRREGSIISAPEVGGKHQICTAGMRLHAREQILVQLQLKRKENKHHVSKVGMRLHTLAVLMLDRALLAQAWWDGPPEDHILVADPEVKLLIEPMFQNK